MWNRIKQLLGVGTPTEIVRDSSPTQYVRFRVDDASRFDSLRRVFAEIKRIKNLDYSAEPSEADASNADYDHELIRDSMPADVQSNFNWPSPAELNDHKLDPTRPIKIAAPGALLGEKWSLVRILELIDTCEYSLDRCELIDENTGELHVYTYAYPYGGLNALMALIEGFRFEILGVNECGKFESRDELERYRQR
jgi:hypothetical protein